MIGTLSVIEALLAALGACFILAMSSPHRKAGMPMPLYVRVAYLFEALKCMTMATHNFNFHYSGDWAILVSRAIDVYFFSANGFSIWQRRLPPAVWDTLRSMALAAKQAHTDRSAE